MHSRNAKSHADAAEHEAKRRWVRRLMTLKPVLAWWPLPTEIEGSVDAKTATRMEKRRDTDLCVPATIMAIGPIFRYNSGGRRIRKCALKWLPQSDPRSYRLDRGYELRHASRSAAIPRKLVCSDADPLEVFPVSVHGDLSRPRGAFARPG